MSEVVKMDNPKVENIEVSEILDLTAGIREAVGSIEDQTTWMPLSFTLSDLEPEEKWAKDQEKVIREKFQERDEKGEVVMHEVTVVDTTGRVVTEMKDVGGVQTEVPMRTMSPKYRDIPGLNAALTELMGVKRKVKWDYKIDMDKMVQFPAHLRRLQHKLMGRVIRVDRSQYKN